MRQNLGLFVAILPQATAVPSGPLDGTFGVRGTNVLWLATWLAPTGIEAQVTSFNSQSIAASSHGGVNDARQGRIARSGSKAAAVDLSH